MKKAINNFLYVGYDKNTISNYKDSIDIRNSKVLRAFCLVFCLFNIIFFFLEFLYGEIAFNAIVAAVTSFLCGCLGMVFHKFVSDDNAKHMKIFRYVGFMCLLSYIVTIYWSTIPYADSLGVFIIALLILFPCLITRYNMTFFIYSLLAVVVYSCLCFFIKDYYFASRDCVHAIIFFICGQLLAYFTSRQTISEIIANEKAEKLNAELSYISMTDTLTKLSNRRAMYDYFIQVEQQQAECSSYAMMIDIDNFKQYNDLYGHQAGDHFLKHFGQELLKIEKQYRVKFYRYGGEEIAAFVGKYDKKDMLSLAEHIRESIENMPIENGRTVSVGYANCSDINGNNLEMALSLADEALYTAKNTGRNKVVFYTK